jgi:hypothetical protein
VGCASSHAPSYRLAKHATSHATLAASGARFGRGQGSKLGFARRRNGKILEDSPRSCAAALCLTDSSPTADPRFCYNEGWRRLRSHCVRETVAASAPYVLRLRCCCAASVTLCLGAGGKRGPTAEVQVVELISARAWPARPNSNCHAPTRYTGSRSMTLCPAVT